MILRSRSFGIWWLLILWGGGFYENFLAEKMKKS